MTRTETTAERSTGSTSHESRRDAESIERVERSSRVASLQRAVGNGVVGSILRARAGDADRRTARADERANETERVGDRACTTCHSPDRSRERAEAGAIPTIQRRTNGGGSSDRFEREAEAVASAFGTGGKRPQSGGGPRRVRGGSAQASSGSMRRGIEVGSRGEPLSGSTRRTFESHFGRDFGGVRVHTGPRADEAARTLGAAAFTTGSHIVFASGNYRPTGAHGRRLLAHELTHVVQQGHAGATGGANTSGREPATRRWADSTVAAARDSGLTIGGAPGVQRQAATKTSATESGERSPAERIEALYDQYQDDTIDMIDLATRLQSFATSHGAEIAHVIERLGYHGDNLAYALANHSTDAELTDFDIVLLERMSSHLGGFFNTFSWGANRTQKARVDEAIERKGIEIGGGKLQNEGGLSSKKVKARLVNHHLRDLVQNGVGGEPSFSREYRETLVEDTVDDMVGGSTSLTYRAVSDLARDVGQRVRTSLLTRKSQGYGRDEGAERSGFAYPDRASDGTAGTGPQVNVAAQDYWSGPHGSGNESYYFTLTEEGRGNAYEAIETLFTPQREPTDRTLIHCDYLLSVVQYRSWAQTIGRERFNRAVREGEFTPVLRWNGFRDPPEGTFAPEEGLTAPVEVPGEVPGEWRTETPLQRVTVSSERDLVIGDHVLFYNHESYDALIHYVGGIWRLENALLIDREGDQARFQGHGYYSPVPKNRLIAGMIGHYNEKIREARSHIEDYEAADDPASKQDALDEVNRYNVYREGDDWVIRGEGFCGTGTWPFRELTRRAAPGLEHPCSGEIEAFRPQHTE